MSLLYILLNSIAVTCKKPCEFILSLKIVLRDTEKKKKKKKNKKNQQDGKAVTEVEKDKKNESQEENAGTKPSHARTFGNGLVIEELAMGKPDGKKASPGKKVSFSSLSSVINCFSKSTVSFCTFRGK